MIDGQEGYAILPPQEQSWRQSNIMKIPNTNLLQQLGGGTYMGGRLWRLPPFSANTWHRHVDQWELYFVLEGTGRMRVGSDTLTVPRYGSVLVRPEKLRQIFNDTSEEVLWLIVGAPQEAPTRGAAGMSKFYPEDPRTLPPELAGRAWPPEDR